MVAVVLVPPVHTEENLSPAHRGNDASNEWLVKKSQPNYSDFSTISMLYLLSHAVYLLSSKDVENVRYYAFLHKISVYTSLDFFIVVQRNKLWMIIYLRSYTVY